VLDNLIVCVLSGGFTAIERTMMQGGEPERVLEMLDRLVAPTAIGHTVQNDYDGRE
jgi:hypothetical protein